MVFSGYVCGSWAALALEVPDNWVVLAGEVPGRIVVLDKAISGSWVEFTWEIRIISVVLA